MGRNHIHMAKGHKGEVISGMRGSCDIYIQIDMEKAIADGITFYISENDVILSAGIEGVIPASYFKEVTDKNGKKLL